MEKKYEIICRLQDGSLKTNEFNTYLEALEVYNKAHKDPNITSAKFDIITRQTYQSFKR